LACPVLNYWLNYLVFCEEIKFIIIHTNLFMNIQHVSNVWQTACIYCYVYSWFTQALKKPWTWCLFRKTLENDFFLLHKPLKINWMVLKTTIFEISTLTKEKFYNPKKKFSISFGKRAYHRILFLTWWSLTGLRTLKKKIFTFCLGKFVWTMLLDALRKNEKIFV
jgi:hypothetical protein